MKLKTLSLIAIAFLTMSVHAQQAPGEFHSERAIPAPSPPGSFREGKPVAQAPGKFDISSDPEILRLKALVESQQKKISLLEAKIKLLEAAQKK